MGRRFVSFAALLLCTAQTASADPNATWTAAQRDQLRTWLNEASQEGVDLPLETRSASSDPAPTETALELARAYLNGSATAAERAGWNIASNDQAIDLPARLNEALARNDLDGFFRSLRPRNPQYEALRLALLRETDPVRRQALLRNLERWRWLPLDMGRRYLLVNVPGFEVGLWEDNREIERWRVVVGKPSTPTPVFSATVTGVTVNPWWEVPPSIVTESVGRLTRTNPAEARRRGYVWGGGSWRQRPGPGNALGAMKLVMPNPYKVYLHDTPSKSLFGQPARAFSHGCIRVDSALAFAAHLLGHPLDAEVAGGKSATVPLDQPLPVYVAYFTADLSAAGAVEFHDDIYRRDARMGSIIGFD